MLPDLLAALSAGPSAVLVAQPGAGKSTLAPLALLGAPWVEDRQILMLAPRRLAVRAAAGRMASLLGEQVGETIGYRVRMESKISTRTRIEVMTEGVFTRMALADPELQGVAAVLFDEFHERSLDADFGLALALDIQQSLRPDLRILPMSATLDDTRLAALLGDAPVVRSEGRAFPIETHYLGRARERWIDEAMAAAIRKALVDEKGGILAFLPGRAEIERTEKRLIEAGLDAEKINLHQLHGGLDPRAQDRAVKQADDGKRKIVLATSIAETSLTIPDIRIVIDSGLARAPRFDPAVGLARLVTERAPISAVDQRRGRAGRIGPGVCYRLWDEAETRGLPAFPRPEILEADLTPLALALADWGASDPTQLAWLDPPPPGPFAAATDGLRLIGALDDGGGITGHGRQLLKIPTPPREAHMIVEAAADGQGKLAAQLSVLLAERGLGGGSVDLVERLRRFQCGGGARADAARRLAERMAKTAGGGSSVAPEHAGAILALAWPDRIAKARGNGGFQMANGRVASVDETDPLARAEWIVIADATGRAGGARIIAAAEISEDAVLEAAGNLIEGHRVVAFNRDAGAVQVRAERRLGRLKLSSQPDATTNAEALHGLLEGVRANGLCILPWSDAAQHWLTRARYATERTDGWPDLSELALLDTADLWLAPALDGKRTLRDIRADALTAALKSLLDWQQTAALAKAAPERITLAGGRTAAVHYETETGPVAEIIIQDAFGLKGHPMAAGAPILLRLLSPARRPAQTTRDIAGFWSGSYHAVRSDLRGRYPKHPWPDDPANATPPVRRGKR